MDSERETSEGSLHIPVEIIEEILVKLGVKSLLRLRCVSKSWLSLIDSKPFIEAHLQYSAKSSAPALISFEVHDNDERCSLRALVEEFGLSPLADNLYEKSDYLCGCNGLACGANRLIHQIWVLNPSTGVRKELPRDGEMNHEHVWKLGLGWDESSGAYKVYAGRGNEGRLYSSKTNSWKTVEDPHLDSTGGAGKFAGGKLHWLSVDIFLSSMDLKSEVFETMELPDGTKQYGEMGCRMSCRRPSSDYVDGRLSLGVVGGCLCLGVEYFDNHKTFDVWVTKRESWEKLASIRLDWGLFRPFRQVADRKGVDLIGGTASGEIMVTYGWSLFVCCPKTGVVRKRQICRLCEPHLYLESLSLVSPSQITSLDI